MTDRVWVDAPKLELAGGLGREERKDPSVEQMSVRALVLLVGQCEQQWVRCHLKAGFST